MTDKMKAKILSNLRILREALDKEALNVEVDPEDRSACHGMARSIDKLIRRTENKVTTEQKEVLREKVG